MGTRRKFSKVSGTFWGQGKLKFWGISGINSPKIFEYQGGDGDNNFGEFANSSADPVTDNINDPQQDHDQRRSSLLQV